MNEIIMILEANNDVLASLRNFYKAMHEDSAFTLGNACSEDLTSFAKKIDEMKHDSAMQVSRARLLVQITSDRKSLVSQRISTNAPHGSMLMLEQILQHLQSQTTQRMEDLTTSMHNIGVGSQKETIIMRIITAVTLIYLPGTFVSVGLSASRQRSITDNSQDLIQYRCRSISRRR